MMGGWIKMRGSLIGSPKLIRIARELQECERFRAWITPGGESTASGQIVSDSALRAVALACLCVTWSCAREFGIFVGDDLILRGICINDIDEMAGVPGIGAAMESVGWAIKSKDGKDVTLPHFKEYNVPFTPAERMKRIRSGQTTERNSAQRNSSGVLRTPRNMRATEKRRVDIPPKPPLDEEPEGTDLSAVHQEMAERRAQAARDREAAKKD